MSTYLYWFLYEYSFSHLWLAYSFYCLDLFIVIIFLETGAVGGNGVFCWFDQVDIWEERKVFGSRGQGLKDEMMGKTPLPSSASNGKSNPIKIVKRDANSVRIVSNQKTLF